MTQYIFASLNGSSTAQTNGTHLKLIFHSTAPRPKVLVIASMDVPYKHLHLDRLSPRIQWKPVESLLHITEEREERAVYLETTGKSWNRDASLSKAYHHQEGIILSSLSFPGQWTDLHTHTEANGLIMNRPCLGSWGTRRWRTQDDTWGTWGVVVNQAGAPGSCTFGSSS